LAALRDLSSEEFARAVAEEFAFLVALGFVIPEDGVTSTPLTAGVLYRGRHVSVELVLERRDEGIDSYVGPSDGRFQSSLFGYLVHYRGYRGSFSKFRPVDPGLPEHVAILRTEARALQELAADVIADSPAAFVVKPRERG
jgi:hypothetical protein